MEVSGSGSVSLAKSLRLFADFDSEFVGLEFLIVVNPGLRCCVDAFFIESRRQGITRNANRVCFAGSKLNFYPLGLLDFGLRFVLGIIRKV
jgi:hypothetical protein